MFERNTREMKTKLETIHDVREGSETEEMKNYDMTDQDHTNNMPSTVSSLSYDFKN